MRRVVRTGYSLALVVVALVSIGCSQGGPVGGLTTVNEASQSENEASQSEMVGVLVGSVMLKPRTPVEGLPNPPPATPLAGVEVRVSDAAGADVASVRSDDSGEYRLELAAGTYQVDLGPLAPLQFSKDVPASVSISAGLETRFDIRVDSGIR